LVGRKILATQAGFSKTTVDVAPTLWLSLPKRLHV
jgi:hypothetical protein